MKKIMMIVALMVTTIAANAQCEAGKVALKPLVGINLANITDEDDTDLRVGLAAGVEAEIGVIDDLLSLSVGAVYSMQGAKENIYDTEDYGISAGKFDAKLKLDYINVPILANFYVTRGLAVKLGVQPGFNVNSKIKVEGYGASAEIDLDKAGVDIKSVDLSIPIGLSYEYSNVVLDARYNWGVTKIANDVDSRNSVFMLTLGYKFNL